MRRIRVAHLITNLALGGAQDYMLLVIRGLDRSKYHPIVAGRLDGEWAELVRSWNDVEWYDIPSLQREISPLNDIKAILEIRRFCREKNIDILHTHSSKAGVVGRLGGRLASVPATIHTVHGFSFHNFMPALQRSLYINVERAMSLFTTALILYSDGDRQTALELGIGAQKSVETFYYGIDYSPFQHECDREAIRRDFGFNPSDVVIGFTGRISEQKALHILIDAFVRINASFPNTRLMIVGDGPLREQLESQAKRNGIEERVLITGFRSDIPMVLRAMDVFVMTSFWEGLSRSLAEAMYANLPIIATDVGGTSDAVRNGVTGWLIPPNDVNAVVQALTEVIGDPERARTIAEHSHKWALHAFDVDTMHKRISKLYDHLMEEHWEKSP